MSKRIVKVHGGEGRAGTIAIAETLGRDHDQLIRVLNKYKANFTRVDPLLVSKVKGKTKSFKEYLLTEDQFALLGMMLQNSDDIVELKTRIILEYRDCRRQLAKALSQKGDADYDKARLTSKTVRNLETDAIKEFVAYAKEQGGTPDGCDRYYANFTRMTNGLLFICGGKFENLREVLTPLQLLAVASAEHIIGKSLREDMKQGIFYKEIYKRAKAKAMQFAELNGQSEVIERALLADEPEDANKQVGRG